MQATGVQGLAEGVGCQPDTTKYAIRRIENVFVIYNGNAGLGASAAKVKEIVE